MSSPNDGPSRLLLSGISAADSMLGEAESPARPSNRLKARGDYEV